MYGTGISALSDDVKSSLAAYFFNRHTNGCDAKSLVTLAAVNKSFHSDVAREIRPLLPPDKQSQAPVELKREGEDIKQFYRQNIKHKYQQVEQILQGRISRKQQAKLNEIDALIASGTLDNNYIARLRMPSIRAVVASEILSIEEVNNLTVEVISAFDSSIVRAYLADGDLSMQQIKNISSSACLALCKDAIRQAYKSGKLSMEDIFKLTFSSFVVLMDPDFRTSGLSIEQALGKHWYDRWAITAAANLEYFTFELSPLSFITATQALKPYVFAYAACSAISDTCKAAVAACSRTSTTLLNALRDDVTDDSQTAFTIDNG